MGWLMANFFLDSTTGDNGDDGTTMDLAWATIEYALESGGLSPGDIVWIRRAHQETPGATAVPIYDGTAKEPIRFIGWPRTTAAITSATWTNGSAEVSLVEPLTLQGINIAKRNQGIYDCSDLTNWAEDSGGDGTSSQVTFDGKSCFKLECPAPAASGDWVGRRGTALGNFIARTVASFAWHHELIGAAADADYAYLLMADTDGSVSCQVKFASDGLFVYDGADWNEVGVNLVVQDTWQAWTFDVTWAEGSSTVDIYLEGVLVGNNIDCSYTGSFTADTVEFRQYGYNTGDVTSYLDYIRVGHDLIYGSSYLGRRVTAPNGESYLITSVTGDHTMTLDREYAGDTVSSTNGAATIDADDDYALAQAINDGAWTIKKADYNADFADTSLIDFSGSADYINMVADNYHDFNNINFISGSSYALSINDGKGTRLNGCLFEASADSTPLYVVNASLVLERFVLEGTGAGGSQDGITLSEVLGRFKDVAINNCGNHGMKVGYSDLYLENVNIGVETANGDDDISFTNWSVISGRDVALGASNGDFDRVAAAIPFSSIQIENYNKVLNAHKEWNSKGEVLKTDVVLASGDPEKRTGGADSVVEILYNQSGVVTATPNSQDYWTDVVFEHEYEADTGTKAYRYYVQAEDNIAATELWLEVEYVSAYDSASEYIIKKVRSDEAVAVRSDAADWDQYIEVTDITPATTSKVRIRCYCSYYDASNKIYIDPLVEIT